MILIFNYIINLENCIKQNDLNRNKNDYFKIEVIYYLSLIINSEYFI